MAVIDFAAKREIIDLELQEAEEARRRAAQLELAGLGTKADVLSARERVAAAKEALEDLAVAQTVASQEAQRAREAARLKERAQHAWEVTGWMERRVSSAQKADKAIALLATALGEIKEADGEIAETYQIWLTARQVGQAPQSDDGGRAMQTFQSALGQHQRDTVLEVALKRAGVGLDIVFASDQIMSVAAHMELINRGVHAQLRKVIPELD